MSHQSSEKQACMIRVLNESWFFQHRTNQEEGRASGSLPVSVHCVEVDLSAQGFIKDKY